MFSLATPIVSTVFGLLKLDATWFAARYVIEDIAPPIAPATSILTLSPSALYVKEAESPLSSILDGRE